MFHCHYDLCVQSQRTRVAHYCASRNITGFSLPTDRHERYLLNRHLLFDDDSQAMFCWVEKIACTEMKRTFAIHKKIMPVKSIGWTWKNSVMARKYFYPLYAKHTLANNTLTMTSRLHRIGNYYKMMIVRHPLDRLLSGYLSKMVPLYKPRRGEFPFPLDVQREIITRYHRQHYEAWITFQLTESLITFPEFIQYILDTDVLQLNPHFRPMIHVCHPCRVHYDYYGNFKTIHNDGFVVAERLGAKRHYFRNKSEHTDRTRSKLKHYYSQLHHDAKMELLHRWWAELDFYYHLYPEERHSHKDILGINVEIYKENQ